MTNEDTPARSGFLPPRGKAPRGNDGRSNFRIHHLRQHRIDEQLQIQPVVVRVLIHVADHLIGGRRRGRIEQQREERCIVRVNDPAPVPGDLDNNGVVNANDASLFTLLLLDGFATYRTMFPTLDPFARADFTGDYKFDGADMSGFVDAYLNTP